MARARSELLHRLLGLITSSDAQQIHVFLEGSNIVIIRQHVEVQEYLENTLPNNELTIFCNAGDICIVLPNSHCLSYYPKDGHYINLEKNVWEEEFDNLLMNRRLQATGDRAIQHKANDRVALSFLRLPWLQDNIILTNNYVVTVLLHSEGFQSAKDDIFYEEQGMWQRLGHVLAHHCIQPPASMVRLQDGLPLKFIPESHLIHTHTMLLQTLGPEFVDKAFIIPFLEGCHMKETIYFMDRSDQAMMMIVEGDCLLRTKAVEELFCFPVRKRSALVLFTFDQFVIPHLTMDCPIVVDGVSLGEGILISLHIVVPPHSTTKDLYREMVTPQATLAPAFSQALQRALETHVRRFKTFSIWFALTKRTPQCVLAAKVSKNAPLFHTILKRAYADGTCVGNQDSPYSTRVRTLPDQQMNFLEPIPISVEVAPAVTAVAPAVTAVAPAVTALAPVATEVAPPLTVPPATPVNPVLADSPAVLSPPLLVDDPMKDSFASLKKTLAAKDDRIKILEMELQLNKMTTIRLHKKVQKYKESFATLNSDLTTLNMDAEYKLFAAVQANEMECSSAELARKRQRKKNLQDTAKKIRKKY